MNIVQLLQNAVTSFQSGKLDNVEVICRRILKTQPNQADALHLLGLVALQRGRHDECVELIERAVQLNPTNASFHANLGEAYRALGRTDQAKSVLRTSLELDPTRAEAHCGLGNVFLAQGDLDNALSCYERALAITPRLAQAQYNIGNIRFERGDIDGAIAAYRRAIAIDDSFSDAHFNLGNVLGARGELVAAAFEYEKAVESAPDFAKGFLALGDVLRKLGRLEVAKKIFEHVVEIDETLARAHLHLGTIAKLQCKLRDAQDHLDRAIALEPDLALAHSERAHVHLLQNRVDDAIDGYRYAIKINPNFAWAHMGLSGALAEAGRLEEAKKLSERAVRLRRTFAWPFMGKDPVGRVLVLKALGTGGHFWIEPNDRMSAVGGINNADSHFDRTKFLQSSLYVDGLSRGESPSILEDCDVIYNAISDIDAVPKAHAIVSEIAAGLSVPIINRPELVGTTQRHANYAALNELEGVAFPKTSRLEYPLVSREDVYAAMTQCGLEFPVLVRRAGTHTGESLARVEDPDRLVSYFQNYPEGPYYLAQFVDFANEHGAYVKMRMYLVDGVPYPSQFFVSDDWNVHVSPRVYRLMAANAWMSEAAERFYVDPEAYLGTNAYRAVASLHSMIPLDYFGVDFTRLRDGTTFIFEANASMRLPYPDTGELDVAPLRKPCIRKIETSLNELLEKKILEFRS